MCSITTTYRVLIEKIIIAKWYVTMICSKSRKMSSTTRSMGIKTNWNLIILQRLFNLYVLHFSNVYRKRVINIIRKLCMLPSLNLALKVTHLTNILRHYSDHIRWFMTPQQQNEGLPHDNVYVILQYVKREMGEIRESTDERKRILG